MNPNGLDKSSPYINDMFKPEKFKNKTALVLGAGKSGLDCANLLVSKGFKVFLSEEKKFPDIKENLKKLDKRVAFETGGHSNKILRAGFAVKSPGIFTDSPVIKKLKSRQIPVFGEVETALSFTDCKNIYAVTGTNGKTTTTALLGEIFKEAVKGTNRKVWVCGNIGTPVSSISHKCAKSDFIVMEISSYQLEDISYFHPAIASVINITPDHLEHHKSMKNYIRAKSKIFRCQDTSDACVFNADDRHCLEISKKCPSRKLFFSTRLKKQKLDCWFNNGHIFYKKSGINFKIQPPCLPGTHNIENSMTALLMAAIAQIKPEIIRKAFDRFKGVEHRIEKVMTIKGIEFINDSKATNVDSTLVALKSIGKTRNIWLILGGLDKGSPYGPLVPCIKKYVKAVLTIGSAAPKIRQELKNQITIIPSQTLENAVNSAARLSIKGDVVLLSPACASFDQFRDFEDRGKKFKKIVLNLCKK